MIDTERLTLRPLRTDDKSDLLKVFGDKEVMKFSDDGLPQKPAWIAQWIKKALANYDKTGHAVYVVIEKRSGEILGYCGLFDYEDIDGKPEVEVGYRLSKDSWGKGYATEAVSKLLEYAHSDLGLTRIIAMIDPQNIASQKVAEKADMKYEKDIMLEGYDHPDLLYVSNK